MNINTYIGVEKNSRGGSSHLKKKEGGVPTMSPFKSIAHKDFKRGSKPTPSVYPPLQSYAEVHYLMKSVMINYESCSYQIMHIYSEIKDLCSKSYNRNHRRNANQNMPRTITNEDKKLWYTIREHKCDIILIEGNN